MLPFKLSSGYHIDEQLFKEYECHRCQFKCQTNCDIYRHLALCRTKNSSSEGAVGAANYSSAGPSGVSETESSNLSQARPHVALNSESSESQAGPSVVEGSDSDIEVLEEDHGPYSEQTKSPEQTKAPKLSGISRTEDILSSLFDDDYNDDDIDSYILPVSLSNELPVAENSDSHEDNSTTVTYGTETICEEHVFTEQVPNSEDTQSETETVNWEEGGSVLISAVHSSNDLKETKTIALREDIIEASQNNDQSTIAAPPSEDTDSEDECIEVSDDEGPPPEPEPVLDTQAYMSHLFRKAPESASASPSRLEEVKPMECQAPTLSSQQFQEIQQHVQQPAIQPPTIQVQQIFTNGSKFVVSTQPKEFMLKCGYSDPAPGKRSSAIIDHGDKDDSPNYEPTDQWSRTTYKCPDCPLQWNSQISRKKHLASSGHGDFGCNLCPFRSVSSAGLKMHVTHLHHDPGVNLHSQRRFLCFICSRRFGSLVRLNNHIQRGHYKKQKIVVDAEMKKKCPECPQTLRQSYVLSKHLTCEGQFMCPDSLCGFKSTTAKGLKIHKGRMHSDATPTKEERSLSSSDDLQCTSCNFRARDSSSHSRHLRAKHLEVWAKINSGRCKTCGIYFESLSKHTGHCKRRVDQNSIKLAKNGQQTAQCSELDNDKVQMLRALSLWPIFQKNPCSSPTTRSSTASKPPSALIVSPAGSPSLVISSPTPSSSLPASPSSAVPTITPSSPTSPHIVALTNGTQPQTTSGKICSMDYLQDLTLPSVRPCLALKTLISEPHILIIGASSGPTVSPVIAPLQAFATQNNAISRPASPTMAYKVKNSVTKPKKQNNKAIPVFTKNTLAMTSMIGVQKDFLTVPKKVKQVITEPTQRPPESTVTLAIGELHSVPLVIPVTNTAGPEISQHPEEQILRPTVTKHQPEVELKQDIIPLVVSKHKPESQHQLDEAIVVTKYKGPSLHWASSQDTDEETESETESFSETKCVECNEVIPTSGSYADHTKTCGKKPVSQSLGLESTPQRSLPKQPVPQLPVQRKSAMFPKPLMKPKVKPSLQPTVVPEQSSPPQQSVSKQHSSVTVALHSLPLVAPQPLHPTKPLGIQLTQPRPSQPWPFLPKRPTLPSTPAVTLPPATLYYPSSQQPEFLGPIAVGLTEEEVVATTSAPSPRPRNTSKEQHKSDEDLDCPNCNFTAMSRTELGHHISTHSGISYQCNQCEYESSSKKRLLRHRQTSHDLQQ